MTQPVGHRGPQPLNYVSPSARPKTGRRKAGPQVGSTASGVKFGGGMGQSLLNGSVGTFQKITEVFLWGFLAQDALAMWLPRVWTSLQEGKETYDPNEDPQVKNKPFGDQVKAWLTGNWKGLNWVNFFEGTKREFATGPGLLAVPATAFMLNRALANPATELSTSSINGFGEGLQHHLVKEKYKNLFTGEKGKESLKNAVKDYVEEAFVDIKRMVEDVSQTPEARVKARELQKIIKVWANAEVDESVKHASLPGPKRLVENVKQAFGQGSPDKNLPALRKSVEEKLWDFNREYRINKYDFKKLGVIVDTNPLNNTGKTWVSYQPEKIEKILADKVTTADIENAKKAVRQTEFANVKNDVARIGGYVNKIWNNHADKEGSKIAEATERTVKELTRNKWLFGGGVTLLTAAYLVKLAFWAQNHGTYQATRLLTDNAAKNNKRSRNEQPNNTQSQAGLPFGSQPAFSRFTTNFSVRPQPSPSLSGNGFIHPSFNQPAAVHQALFQGKKTEGGQA